MSGEDERMGDSTQQTLARGAEGPQVAELQRRLVEFDFKPGEIDGVFGVLTESAVKAFQTLATREPHGIVDETTWEKLQGEGLPEDDPPGGQPDSTCAAKAPS